MRYETTTSLTPAEALAHAEQFFVDSGVPLDARERNAIRFAGGGGHVQVSVLDTSPTRLDVETREWDQLAQQWIHRLPR